MTDGKRPNGPGAFGDMLSGSILSDDMLSDIMTGILSILNHGKALRASFLGHETVDLDVTVRLKIRAPRNVYDHWTAIARLKG